MGDWLCQYWQRPPISLSDWIRRALRQFKALRIANLPPVHDFVLTKDFLVIPGPRRRTLSSTAIIGDLISAPEFCSSSGLISVKHASSKPTHGVVDSFDFADTVSVEEHLWRPADNNRAGWLISTILDHQHQKTALCLVDAGNLSAGPRSRINLPHPIPLGLHGCFV